MSEQQSIEELYVKEKNKVYIFMGTTALFVVLFAASLFLGWGSSSSVPSDVVSIGTGTPPAGLEGGPGGGPGGSRGVSRFLDEDGDVNTDAIAETIERAAQLDGDSSVFIERIIGQIESALENGEITYEQAAALMDAFGI